MPNLSGRVAYLFQCCNSKVKQVYNWLQNQDLIWKINQCKKRIYAQHLAAAAAELICVGIYLAKSSSSVAVTLYNSCD